MLFQDTCSVLNYQSLLVYNIITNVLYVKQSNENNYHSEAQAEYIYKSFMQMNGDETHPSLCLKCLKAKFRTSCTKGSGTG